MDFGSTVASNIANFSSFFEKRQKHCSIGETNIKSMFCLLQGLHFSIQFPSKFRVFFLSPEPHFFDFWCIVVPKCAILEAFWRPARPQMASKFSQMAQKCFQILSGESVTSPICFRGPFRKPLGHHFGRCWMNFNEFRHHFGYMFNELQATNPQSAKAACHKVLHENCQEPLRAAKNC